MNVRCKETCSLDGFYYEEGRDYVIDLPKKHPSWAYFEAQDTAPEAPAKEAPTKDSTAKDAPTKDSTAKDAPAGEASAE